MSGKFKKPSATCEQSQFANRIFKLIYLKNNGSIEESVEEAKPFFSDLKEHVRNIYQYIDEEIPLYAYYELTEYGADNYGMTDKEFNKAKENAIKACKVYYEESKKD